MTVWALCAIFSLTVGVTGEEPLPTPRLLIMFGVPILVGIAAGIYIPLRYGAKPLTAPESTVATKIGYVTKLLSFNLSYVPALGFFGLLAVAIIDGFGQASSGGFGGFIALIVGGITAVATLIGTLIFYVLPSEGQEILRLLQTVSMRILLGVVAVTVTAPLLVVVYSIILTYL